MAELQDYATTPITPTNKVSTAKEISDLQALVDVNTAKVSNVAHPLVETAVPLGAEFTDTQVDIQAGTNITIDKTNPLAPIINSSGGGGGAGGQVDSIVAGTNVTVNATDPVNPIVSATDTVYNDTAIQAEVTANTAKVTYPSADSTKVSKAIISDIAGITGGTAIVNTVSITQANYDALSQLIKDDTTIAFYVRP